MIGMDDRQYSGACGSWLWAYGGVSVFKKLNSRIFNRFGVIVILVYDINGTHGINKKLENFGFFTNVSFIDR